MARLLVHVEGQTEEVFVNELLREHLIGVGFESVSARIVGNARLRQRRGGIRPWPSVRKDIINHLKEDAGCLATTMVDFCGLPRDGDGAWPGRAEVADVEPRRKAALVEDALAADLARQVGEQVDPSRFIPFVVLHEFEGLLFSDCVAFARGMGRMEMEPHFRRIRDAFATPEDINDSPDTCPSKRVIDLAPGYEKPLFGTLAALEIGLTRIRAECPHFDEWLQNVESRA
jgi:hypothetical protein